MLAHNWLYENIKSWMVNIRKLLIPLLFILRTETPNTEVMDSESSSYIYIWIDLNFQPS